MISIVMAYYNRPQQLTLTLRTIEHYCKDPIEIIIVDDASSVDKHAVDVVLNFTSLNIKLVDIDKDKKWWTNPCKIGRAHV